jgi:hypothetical protein
MADQVTIEGKEYISSKRASELSGYSQDYIGQLARGGAVDAQRVGGLWFVYMPALEAYKLKAESYKPEPPQRVPQSEPESLLTFDGKDYVSAARAAKLTGYHQDYVGQLARSGTVLSRQVGNRWFVERDGIQSHKREKDALLAAVQADSVGLSRPESSIAADGASEIAAVPLDHFFTYTSDTRDLLPVTHESVRPTIKTVRAKKETRLVPVSTHVLALPRQTKILDHKRHVKHVKSPVRKHGKTIFYGSVAAAAFLVVIVATIQLSNRGGGSMYAAAGNTMTTETGGIVSGLVHAVARIGDALETLVTTELVYVRSK